MYRTLDQRTGKGRAADSFYAVIAQLRPTPETVRLALVPTEKSVRIVISEVTARRWRWAKRGAVRNARQMRQRLEVARTRVSAAEQRAVRYLRKTMKLGHRDAGSILGLSHQRVHQLEKKKAG